MNKKITALLITAALLASAVPAAFAADADTAAASSAVTSTEQPPAKPDGEAPNGEEPPAKPDGEADAKPLPFEDVASDAWYHDVVSQAYTKGLISGMSDTEFSPESSVTAAQLLTMLYRADGNKTTAQSSGNWYDEAVAWAKQNSVITDNDGWNFDAEAQLTREQMMVILFNFMNYKGIDLSESADLSSFTDNGEISEYASNAVKALVAKSIIQGDGDTLRPQSSLTRAETAVILLKSVNLLPQQGGQMPGSGEMPPAKPDGEMPGSGEMPPAKPDGSNGGFGGSGVVTQGTSANTIDTDGEYSNESYSSTGDNENALRIDGANVTLDNVTVSKSAGASANTEDGDFYGQNAAFLATNGANAIIKNTSVTSSATNGNGIFSYGAGTKVTVSDTSISTTGDHSGGLQTTGGAETEASNLTINTSGKSSAAIRTDRGGGTVNVTGGTYTSNGTDSPAVYSTASITVSDAELTANGAEALVIEGKNSITLNNCNVTGNMSSTDGASSSENVHNVMIYQSMSGDAEVGTSKFDMTDGSLTGDSGDMFYFTNTHSVVNLKNVAIKNNDDDAYLIRVTGNSASRGWGKAGSNGAQVEFNVSNQTLDGDIIVDTISTLDLKLSDNSSFTGTVNIVDNEQGGAAADNNADVTIEEGSVWTLTGDCTLSSLENNGTINYNGHTITLADGTVLK